MIEFVLATRSVHKADEVRAVLAAASCPARVLSIAAAGVAWSKEEDALERWETFEENAAAKARYFARRSGRLAVADDSGLEVEALGGRPGVRTKRFATLEAYPGLAQDDANNQRLLELLADVPPARRRARYVCVAVLFDPAAGALRSFRGETSGRILRTPRGCNGFGYDPLFMDEDGQRSFAELAPEEKNERSHRGKAFRALATFLGRGSSLQRGQPLDPERSAAMPAS